MKLKAILGVLISIIFVYLAFRNVDFGEMLAAMRSANYLWLVPVFFAMLTSHWLRAVRHHYFLAPIKPVRSHPLFSALMIGYAGNNLLPLRMGEFLRAYALGKSQNLSKTSAFATVLVERVVDLLSLLVILAIAVLVYPLPQNIKNWGYIIFALTVTAIVVMVLLMEKTEATLAFFEKILPARLFAGVQKTAHSFLQGFVVLKKTEHYGKIVLLSLGVWFLYVMVVYLSFYAFDFPQNYALNLTASLVVLATVSIGIMIPASPGFVGTYHWFCMTSLAFYHVPQSEALSFAVVSHALNTIPFTLIGLGYFWRENLHFADAVAERELVEQAPPEELPR